MLKHLQTISLLAAAMLAATPLGADAQAGSAQGRALFEQKGCTQCHAFEARSLGPSVRDMKARLKGSPNKASAAMLAASGHADDLKSTPRSDVRALAEWLAGSSVEVEVAVPKPPAKPADSAADKREALAQAKRDAAAKAQAETEAKAQAQRDAAAAKADAGARAQANRDAADFARRAEDAKARQDTAAVEAIRREAEAKAKADALAAQQREADERARHEAEAKAKRDAEALAAQQRDAEAKAKKESPPTTAAKAEPTSSGNRKQLAYRDGSDLPPCAAPTGAPLGSVDEENAKSIIDRVGCPQCHAYVQKKTGPPMKKIYEKYKNDWECVVFRLRKNKTHNDEGVTQDIKGNEFKIVADYIATRGK